MTPVDPTVADAATTAPPVRARRAGFARDLLTIAFRALRLTRRDPEAVLPALIVSAFFFAINVGSLQRVAEASAPGFDFKAFQLPVAILFGVTGLSRASAVVIDIQNGYFDRLLVTPVRRLALLLGHMAADFAVATALAIPTTVLAFVIGVRFATGPVGVVVFILLCGAWGLVFSGFPYAIALKTGNPAAVNSSFILFFPFMFLTTTFLPQELLSGWLATVADYNPVTYLLVGTRALVSGGWDLGEIAQALGAIGAVGTVSITLALLALRSRVARG